AGASFCPNISFCRIRAGGPPPGSARTRGSRPSCCRSCARPSGRRSAAGSILLLDALHILIAKAEMVADFVDHDMAHDIGEVLPGFAPVIEDRPAIEKDRVDPGLRIADALLRQRDTAIEAHQVERAVEPHRSPGLAVRK